MTDNNEVIVMALSEAGYPPDHLDTDRAMWVPPLPPLDVVEKARDIAYPGTEVERLDPNLWPTLAAFDVDLTGVAA